MPFMAFPSRISLLPYTSHYCGAIAHPGGFRGKSRSVVPKNETPNGSKTPFLMVVFVALRCIRRYARLFDRTESRFGRCRIAHVAAAVSRSITVHPWINPCLTCLEDWRAHGLSVLCATVMGGGRVVIFPVIFFLSCAWSDLFIPKLMLPKDTDSRIFYRFQYST